MDDQRLMTPRQADFLRTLAVETLGEAEAADYIATLRNAYPRPTQGQAREWIIELKDRKAQNPITKPPHGRGGLMGVAAGRYALTASDGTVVLYKVDRPGEGKFAGWTFVSRVRDNGYETRLSKRQAAPVLEEISRDPMDALVAYGRRTGECGVCGRKLSDPDSVEAGIGPICAAKVGSR